MAECNQYEKSIKQFIAGEISREDEQSLLQHIEQCQHCKELIEVHYRLALQDFDLPDAAPEDFTKVRQNVIRAIRKKETAHKITWYHHIADHISSLFTRPVVAASAAVVLFLAGFFLSSIILPTPSRSESDLIQHLKYTAQQNTDLQQVENSPYLFSDVRIKNVNGGQVALGFNVSTHLELIRPKDDPLVKEVVAQAVLNPTSLGNRLKAISYSEEIMDPKVREALIFILLNDDNLAVRIKAITSLAKYPADTQIQEAFLRILNEEESVQLRLMAIDYLTNQELNKQTLEDAIMNLDESEDAFIRYKLYQQTRN